MRASRGGQTGSYLAVSVLLPLVGASLGISGGAIFQILALENLGLDPNQIGLAVGLGVISIPFQLWAARIPLRRARQNLRIFFVVLAALCWLLAFLVPRPVPAGATVIAVIAIAVVAELALSVLFATSWQPLLSVNVSGPFRQRLNAQAGAASRLLMISVVFIFGLLGVPGRVAILIVVGLVALTLLLAIEQIPPVDETGGVQSHTEKEVESGDRGEAPTGLVVLYVAAGVGATPAWVFFVTYAAGVFWPTANLGLVGAALTVGGLVAAAGWRPTDHRLLARARLATMAMLACAVGLIPIDRPVSGSAAGALVLVLLAIASGSITTMCMSLLELVHQRTTAATSVRTLTTLDVVGSTSMQVGFLAAGFLITMSIDSTWPIDPYLLSLLVLPAVLLIALWSIPAHEPTTTVNSGLPYRLTPQVRSPPVPGD